MIMSISPSDFDGDEDTVRRVLVLARDIAPCIDSLSGESKKDAIAILKGVIAELPEPGSRRTRALSRNGTSMTFAEIESAFDDDARRSLRSLCSAQSTSGSLPAGSFPKQRAFARVWPEGPYT